MTEQLSLFDVEFSGVLCSRCHRLLASWPLQRGDRCSPKDWIYCIRPIAT